MHPLYYQAQTTGNMWDTWLFWHAGTHYLYHLAGPGGQWYGIALATSTDGVHWQEHGLVLEKAPGVTWLGTGTVWQLPPTAAQPAPRFMLNFSEWRGDRQSIFFAHSSDLVHWQRLGPETEFTPDPRWYRDTGGNDSRWDCIYTLPRPTGGWYGYWTANPLSGPGFGFGESADGVHWQARPPPALEWGTTPPLPVIESGAVALIGGRAYTMLGTYAAYGDHAAGMFTCTAPDAAGPWQPQAINFALLTSPKGRWHTYFTRFYPCRDELLVNHHAIAPGGAVWFAPLKLAHTDAAGTLRLRWWPGNDLVSRTWPATQVAAAPSGHAIAYAPAAGLLLTTRLTGGQPQTLTVVCADGQATRCTFHPSGMVALATLAPDGTATPLEQVDRQLPVAAERTLRVLALHHFVELYLDDYLLQVHALPAAPLGQLQLTCPGAMQVHRGA